MTLNSEDEIARALGVTSLEKLPESKLRELVDRFPDIPEELQLHLMKTNLDLQKYALNAIAAVEDQFRATLSSIDSSNQQVFIALSEARKITAGELDKDDIGDERWRLLMERLDENTHMAVAVDAETKKLIAQQAHAARRSNLAVTVVPLIDGLVRLGVRILVARGKI